MRLTTATYHSPSGRNIDRKPGETTWGVDPTDGYFIPMSSEQAEQLQKRRQENRLLGDGSKSRPPSGELTPAIIAKQHNDPQLAAALRTLVAKVTTGEFEKVGGSSQEARSHAQRHGDLMRREVLLKSLKELNRELMQLENADAPAKN